MWRKSASRAQENHDSDQSISEEEEEGDCAAGSAVSLARAGDKGGIQVLSQLEILRDSYELHLTEEEAIPSQERKGGHLVDDEIENPLFFGGDCSNRSSKIYAATLSHSFDQTFCLPTVASILPVAEEIISDDEMQEISSPVLKSAREYVGGTWSEATREAEAFVGLNQNSIHSLSHGTFVKENKLYKGGGDRTKSKPKFMFRSHSHTRDVALVVSDGNGSTSTNSLATNEIGAAADNGMSKFTTVSKLIAHKEKSNQSKKNLVPSEPGHRHDFCEHSVAEFLERFSEDNDLPQGSSKQNVQGVDKRRLRMQMVLNRNETLLGHRDVEGDQPEVLDSPFSSNDGENPQCLKLVLPRRTMVDQFHDAFGKATAINERSYSAFPGSSSSSCGIYQRLQQVLQREKVRDIDYLKNTNGKRSASSDNEKMCIYVRILSRSLEAKLIVCSCISVGDGQKCYQENNLHMTMDDAAATLTIIFNPRVCSDVELEAGSLICVHQPWKEVQVKGKDDVILLCSYFSQLQP